MSLLIAGIIAMLTGYYIGKKSGYEEGWNAGIRFSPSDIEVGK